MKPIIDMAGERFGRWTAIQVGGRDKRGKPLWLCQCDCGTTSLVSRSNLRRGGSMSCGCLKTERQTTHGNARKRGRTTPEYRAWRNIKSRCTNENSKDWPRYGGRGIRVCDRWMESFESFLGDMGKRPSRSHSLDRINNDGDYTPENCRWATPREQGCNRHNNRVYTFRGETLIESEWCRRLGLRGMNSVSHRLGTGWSLEEALTIPNVRRHD